MNELKNLANQESKASYLIDQKNRLKTGQIINNKTTKMFQIMKKQIFLNFNIIILLLILIGCSSNSNNSDNSLSLIHI